MATRSAAAAPTHWLVAAPVTACAATMAGQATPRALLLDCLGTLVRLQPPAPRLRAPLRARTGVEGGPAEADAAMRAEIAYYRAHLHEAVDPAALSDLRDRCAEVVRDVLPGLAPVAHSAIRGALLDALVFTP